MRRAALALAATCLAALATVPAKAETLIAALSTHRIAIASNFTGDQLAVFGLVERDGRSVARADPFDIVVTVRGPQRMLIVREKERVGPIWINRNQRRFPDRSIYLSVATNRPIKEILSEDAARRDRIGLANAQRSQTGFDFDFDIGRYRDALIRTLEGKRLYLLDERGVTFLSPALFSSQIKIPATAPTGPYEVEVLLYAGGSVLARQTTNFEVVKTGAEQSMASAAHERPFLYGLATAVLALLFGWLATVIFRRD
ncbi:TIGR02186 family protein [Bosea vestrisii]|uniref:TIGR02186 family protein n=1 Tax=Bosea vestrisii TaxID=151416 RepID=UPI0024DF3BC5|nr:TIGR02186 family protein [Bosea vestrisii]WID95521.1 TIGR02186 family protein [Bosea vestrisii]